MPESIIVYFPSLGSHLLVKVVDNDAETQLNQEQGAQDPRVRGRESMMLIDGATAATE